MCAACRLLLFWAALLFVLPGCTPPSARRAIERAEILADSLPDSALAVLASVDPATLRGEFRPRHALLTVKARDKAYIPHTSDSLVNIAIDYYGDDTHGIRSAEAHYYYGRVNADLGNHALALKGFHQALPMLADVGADSPRRLIYFKGAVLSQQADLLFNMNLSREGIAFMREAAWLDSILADSVNLFYDLRSLGVGYLNAGMTDSARRIVERAMPLTRRLPPERKAELYVIAARADYIDNDFESARKHLGFIKAHMDSTDNSPNLSLIAKVYDAINRPDSAAYYARLLLDRPHRGIQSEVLWILAKQSFRTGNIDTIYKYVDRYADGAHKMIVNQSKFMNVSDSTLYRQMLTEIDNARLRADNARLTGWTYALALLAAASVIIVLAILYHRVYRRQKDSEAIVGLQHLVISRTDPLPEHESGRETDSRPKATTRERLVETLLSRMESLAEAGAESGTSLRDSDTVRRLVDMAVSGTVLAQSSELWAELEDEVRRVSPDFRSNFGLLLGTPSVNDYHIALLIKAGLTPTQISVLLSRAKGTISNNRQRMCERIFNRKISNSLFDELIRSL